MPAGRARRRRLSAAASGALTLTQDLHPALQGFSGQKGHDLVSVLNDAHS